MDTSKFLEKLSPDEKRWLDFVVGKQWYLHGPKILHSGYNPTYISIDFFNQELMKDEKWHYFSLYPINGFPYQILDDCYSPKNGGWVKSGTSEKDAKIIQPTFKWICVERENEEGELDGQNIITMVPVCNKDEDMFAYIAYLQEMMQGNPNIGNKKVFEISSQLATLFCLRERHSDFRYYLHGEEDKKFIINFFTEKYSCLKDTWPQQLKSWLTSYPFDDPQNYCLYHWDKHKLFLNDLGYLID